MSTDEFDAVRADTDPVRQARRATELLALYGQRSAELARLRKAAIERAHDEFGLTYTELAAKVGLTKGRVTQIRKTAPPAERAFFGVGPITVAIPVRPLEGRTHGVVALEDSAAAEQLGVLLASLSLETKNHHIQISGWQPSGETVAICGPKSSPAMSDAISADPTLSFQQDTTGQWVIANRATGERFASPIDQGDPTRDIAYIARLRHGGQSLLIIAGIHALGSVGAVEYLRRNLKELHDAVGESDFSLVISSTFDATTVTDTKALWGPQTHL